LVGRGKVYEEIASDHRLLAILDRQLALGRPFVAAAVEHGAAVFLV
jgi:hypothetical protein